MKQSSRAKIDNLPTQLGGISREVKGRNPQERRKGSAGLNSRYFSNGVLSPATAEVQVLVLQRWRQKVGGIPSLPESSQVESTRRLLIHHLARIPAAHFFR